MARNDEDDIIGDRPKRRDVVADLGPLFAGVENVTLPPELPVKDATGAPIGRVVDLTTTADGGVSAAIELNEAGRNLLDQLGATPGSYLEDDEDDDAWEPSRDPGDKVWDAAEPEPAGAPTKAERLEAIERLKHKARPRILSLAESTIGAPEPLAGVTAADAFIIMGGEAEAALLGQESRAWSWLGPWLAALAREGALRVYRVKGHPVRRQSRRKQSHGNAHVVYLHPRDPLGFPVEDGR